MDLQRGFVLHRRPYSETSLLVDLFTEETGRNVLHGNLSYSLLRHYFFVGQEKAH